MAPYSSEGSELFYSLNAPAYSIAEASRLVGLTRWSISRYLRGYDYKYFTKDEIRDGHQPPVINQSTKKTTYASFLDLIDLHFVKEFLNRGISLQHIRLALNEAKEHLGTPHFARNVFYTFGNDIILKLPKDGSLIALLRGGQIGITEIIEKFSDKLDFEDITGYGFVRRFYPKGKSASIVIDPQISFGRPTLVGRGVATYSIYDLYLGESEQVEPVSEWFNIPVPEIQAAVQFEHSLWA